MKKEVSPMVAAIIVVVVIVVAVFLYWKSQPHQAATKGMPAMSTQQQKGFEALKNLAPGAGGVPSTGPSGAAANPGLNAMQRAFPGAKTPGH